MRGSARDGRRGQLGRSGGHLGAGVGGGWGRCAGGFGDWWFLFFNSISEISPVSFPFFKLWFVLMFFFRIFKCHRFRTLAFTIAIAIPNFIITLMEYYIRGSTAIVAVFSVINIDWCYCYDYNPDYIFLCVVNTQTSKTMGSTLDTLFLWACGREGVRPA